jgi:hypothetical protein
VELDAVDAEELLVLLDEGVAGLGEDAHELVLGELFEGGDDGEAADELGDEAELEEVFALHLAQELADALILRGSRSWRR